MNHLILHISQGFAALAMALAGSAVTLLARQDTAGEAYDLVERGGVVGVLLFCLYIAYRVIKWLWKRHAATEAELEEIQSRLLEEERAENVRLREEVERLKRDKE